MQDVENSCIMLGVVGVAHFCHVKMRNAVGTFFVDLFELTFFFFLLISFP
jgi:hypothetical protein